MIYLDTSILVSYYLPELLSEQVELFLQSLTKPPIISVLVQVELFSALSKRVRMRELSKENAQSIATLFEQHLVENLYQIRELKLEHYQLTQQWLKSFNLPLRTLRWPAFSYCLS